MSSNPSSPKGSATSVEELENEITKVDHRIAENNAKRTQIEMSETFEDAILRGDIENSYGLLAVIDADSDLAAQQREILSRRLLAARSSKDREIAKARHEEITAGLKRLPDLIQQVNQNLSKAAAQLSAIDGVMKQAQQFVAEQRANPHLAAYELDYPDVRHTGGIYSDMPGLDGVVLPTIHMAHDPSPAHWPTSEVMVTMPAVRVANLRTEEANQLFQRLSKAAAA